MKWNWRTPKETKANENRKQNEKDNERNERKWK